MFRMHRSHPSVQRLQLHLPNQQSVTFSGSADVADILNQNHDTTLTQFFATNGQFASRGDDGPSSSLHLLYTDFPTKFSWNLSLRQWSARKQRSSSIYNTNLAHLIRQTRLILWDEAPMQNRRTLEAVDRSLQDICRSSKTFGGIPMVLSGDFRQILPVIPRASQAQTVSLTLKRSYFWNKIGSQSIGRTASSRYPGFRDSLPAYLPALRPRMAPMVRPLPPG